MSVGEVPEKLVEPRTVACVQREVGNHDNPVRGIHPGTVTLLTSGN